MKGRLKKLFLRFFDKTIQAHYSTLKEDFPIYNPQATIALLDFPINQEPLSERELLKEYESLLLDGSINKFKREFMAFVDSGNADTNILAAPFIELFSQNQIVVETDSPRSTFIEIKLVNWMRELIGWVKPGEPFPANPLDACGTFCASGSTANLLGLLAARSHAYPNVRQDGMQAVNKRSFVLLPETSHYSMRNAVWASGLGLNSIVSVRVDSGYRMDPDCLRKTVTNILKVKENKIVAVMAAAGNSYTMSIDPISEIARICKDFGIYFHVDACNGGAVLFSDSLRSKLKDIHLADSVSFDPHKNLSVTYPSSLVLFKQKRDLEKIVSEYGNIVNNPESYDLGTINPVEGSRGFHSLKLWLLIRYYGCKGIGRRIDQNQENTLYLNKRLHEELNFLPLHKPDLFNQAFIILPKNRDDGPIKASDISSLNFWLFEEIKKERKYFIHHYRIRFSHPDIIIDEEKSFVLCAMFGNSNITKNDIDGLIDHMNSLLVRYEKNINKYFPRGTFTLFDSSSPQFTKKSKIVKSGYNRPIPSFR